MVSLSTKDLKNLVGFFLTHLFNYQELSLVFLKIQMPDLLRFFVF